MPDEEKQNNKLETEISDTSPPIRIYTEHSE